MSSSTRCFDFEDILIMSSSGLHGRSKANVMLSFISFQAKVVSVVLYFEKSFSPGLASKIT